MITRKIGALAALAGGVVALLMSVASSAMASTEYILVISTSDAEVAIDASNDAGMVIGRPLEDVTTGTTNGYCGKKSDGFGGYTTDSNFTGTAYGTWVLMTDTTEAKPTKFLAQAWVMGEDLTPGRKLSSWTVQYSGETCLNQASDGSTYTYKKYAVTCDSCTAEERKTTED